MSTTTWRNWARTAQADGQHCVEPATEDELAAVVRDAAAQNRKVKAVGAGHSFTTIAQPEGVLVSTEKLRGLVRTDGDRVTLRAGTHLWELPAILEPLGLAMTNLGDINRQSIAGAISTGTHGTGLRFGGVATQVSGLRLVDGHGQARQITADQLPGARVGLGALGILTEVELQLVPAFQLQAIERPEQVSAVLNNLDERVEGTDHFEFYWWPHTEVAMTKTNTRLPMQAPSRPVGAVAGFIEDRLLANGAHRAVCALGHLLPRLTPPINRLSAAVYGNRTYTERSTNVFTHPRNNRFRELEYAIAREALPEAFTELKQAHPD